ncbi:MAG: 3-oxoacyl-ACP reductase FabG [Planctomycetes bacterium]|nr:3-oxoacyl-ACP reductase FabG [Planctomycetota bacterium]
MTKIALVTGASRGIGRAIATRLSKDGYRIWINYANSEAPANELCSEIEAAGGSAIAVKFDVGDAAAVKAALEPLVKEEAIPDVIVANAGITRDGLLAMMSADDWNNVISTNLGGFFNVVQPMMKQMLRRRSGRIIGISSLSGQAGNPGQVNYSASKAGLIGACKALAKEIAKRKITVNVVAPGFIETDMVADLPIDEISKQIPAGRFGQPEEIADAVAFLASDSAAYITGQVLGVNGGMYM